MKKKFSKNCVILPCPQSEEIVPGTNGATPGNTAWLHAGTIYTPGDVVVISRDKADELDAAIAELVEAGVAQATDVEPTKK